MREPETENLIQKLVNYFSKPIEETKDMAPEEVCPVCWGFQQYDGKIREKIKDKQVDVNNQKDTYLVIQDFVKTNIDGFKLKVGQIEECPECSGWVGEK